MSLAHRFLSRVGGTAESAGKGRVLRIFLAFVFLAVGVVVGYAIQNRLFSSRHPRPVPVRKHTLANAITPVARSGGTPSNGTSSNRTDNGTKVRVISPVKKPVSAVKSKVQPAEKVAKRKKPYSRVVKVRERAGGNGTSLVADGRSLEVLELLERATKAFKEGRFGEAVSLYRRVLRLSPYNRKALLNLGIIYYRLGRESDAIGCFSRLLERYPRDVDAMNNLAVVYMERGLYNKALELLKGVLKVDPVNRVALINEGICLERMGRRDEALEVFKRGMELYPKEYRFYLYAGVLLYEDGDVAAAYPLLERAYSLLEDKAGPEAELLRRVLER